MNAVGELGVACAGVALHVAETDAQIEALAGEWDALWRRAQASPFQSPAWALPWWRRFGTSAPRIVTLRIGGALKALLPLYLLDEGRERKLLFVGVGISDYCDALIDRDAPLQAADWLLETALVRARRDGVTSCALTDLPPEAAIRTAAVPPGWREMALGETPCPVLTLQDSLASTVPARMLRKIRMSRHRAARIGDCGVKVATGGDALGAWDDLARLHRARWHALGTPNGVLGDPLVQAFHRDAVPRLADAGILRLHLLRLRGEVAAAYHTMAGSGRLLFYLSAFAEREAFVSPGTLLLAAIAERAIAEGLRELHFLRGGEAYKYAWGAVDRPNTGRLLTPP